MRVTWFIFYNEIVGLCYVDVKCIPATISYYVILFNKSFPLKLLLRVSEFVKIRNGRFFKGVRNYYYFLIFTEIGDLFRSVI